MHIYISIYGLFIVIFEKRNLSIHSWVGSQYFLNSILELIYLPTFYTIEGLNFISWDFKNESIHSTALENSRTKRILWIKKKLCQCAQSEQCWCLTWLQISTKSGNIIFGPSSRRTVSRAPLFIYSVTIHIGSEMVQTPNRIRMCLCLMVSIIAASFKKASLVMAPGFRVFMATSSCSFQ